MKTNYGHLTYCSNIHPGESWEDHFEHLKKQVPAIKQQTSPNQPFALGLRLADAASKTLQQEVTLRAFREWLADNDVYVFTMNGFPFGNFHHSTVKDKVHAPDWLSTERTAYTIRLAQILAQLLPEGMEGSISTSPLTYRFWYPEVEWDAVFQQATGNLLQVVEALIDIRNQTGRLIHIDIEPEPDGLLDNCTDFLQWYNRYLLPMGIQHLQQQRGMQEAAATEAILSHIQLCYDICHFAVGYENHASMIRQLQQQGIRTGKVQVSAALKADMRGTAAEKAALQEAFSQFDEPVYLHQVIAATTDGTLLRYRDMRPALEDIQQPDVVEWRAHYHVPIFMESYGALAATQADIKTVLDIQRQHPFTPYLEVETYTWEVLPGNARLPVDQSISRELQWVKALLDEK